MGDVKDILLGFGKSKTSDAAKSGATSSSSGAGRGTKRGRGSRKRGRGSDKGSRMLAGLSRWGWDPRREKDMHDEPLVSLVPTQVGPSRKKGPGSRKWRLKPFSNSARADGLKLRHWERLDTEFPDYPFARFNKQISLPEIYTDAEYVRLAHGAPGGGPPWSRADTDHLWALCRQLDLRWHVIHDRFSATTPRSLTVLKARMMSVLQQIVAMRSGVPVAQVGGNAGAGAQAAAAAAAGDANAAAAAAAAAATGAAAGTGTGTAAETTATDPVDADWAYEERRIQQLEAAFRRPRADENEEKQLKFELKRIEAQLRKMKREAKKSGVSLVGVFDDDDTLGLAPAGRGRKKKRVVKRPGVKQFGPPAHDGSKVYLRSSRLQAKAAALGVSSRLLAKMNLVLEELGVPERPMPTGRVCAAYDKLRQDIVKVLALQKHVAALEKAKAKKLK